MAARHAAQAAPRLEHQRDDRLDGLEQLDRIAESLRVVVQDAAQPFHFILAVCREACILCVAMHSAMSASEKRMRIAGYAAVMPD